MTKSPIHLIWVSWDLKYIFFLAHVASIMPAENIISELEVSTLEDDDISSLLNNLHFQIMHNKTFINKSMVKFKFRLYVQVCFFRI